MEFVVVKSTESSNGGFVTTISHNAEVEHPDLGTIFRKKRFCIKTGNQLEAGKKAEIDLAKYDVATLESEVVDEESGELTTISTRWLFLR